MHNGLEDGDAGSPSMEKVEIIVGNLENADEGVVAESKKDGRDEVERCKCACATSKGSYDRLVLLAPVQGQAPSNVQARIYDEHEEVPASWKGAVIDGGGDLESSVVFLLV